MIFYKIMKKVRSKFDIIKMGYIVFRFKGIYVRKKTVDKIEISMDD